MLYLAGQSSDQIYSKVANRFESKTFFSCLVCLRLHRNYISFEKKNNYQHDTDKNSILLPIFKIVLFLPLKQIYFRNFNSKMK